MGMSNNNLKIFSAVAKNKSITKTANELFVSQPAISKAIKTLEEELQIKLFHRDKRKGLYLTSAGEKILLLVSQMEDIENKIYQTAYAENNFLGGTVKIASIPIITTMILSSAFKEFREKYPLVKVELIEGTTSEVRAAVLEHKVDFGLSTSPFQELDTKFMLLDKMCAISSQPLSKKVNLYKEPAENLIFCHAGQETAMEVLHSYNNIHFEKSFIVKQPETVVKFVENGHGIGIISDFVLSSINQHYIYKAEIEPEIEIEIGMTAINFSELSPAAAKMKETIEEQISSQFH